MKKYKVKLTVNKKPDEVKNVDVRRPDLIEPLDLFSAKGLFYKINEIIDAVNRLSMRDSDDGK